MVLREGEPLHLVLYEFSVQQQQQHKLAPHTCFPTIASGSFSIGSISERFETRNAACPCLDKSQARTTVAFVQIYTYLKEDMLLEPFLFSLSLSFLLRRHTLFLVRPSCLLILFCGVSFSLPARTHDRMKICIVGKVNVSDFWPPYVNAVLWQNR